MSPTRAEAIQWRVAQAAVHAAFDATNLSDWVYVDAADLPAVVGALTAADVANLRGCDDKVAAYQLSCMVDGPDSPPCKRFETRLLRHIIVRGNKRKHSLLL